MPPLQYSLIASQSNLNKIQELQPSLQPLAQELLRQAALQGILLRVVQAYRTPDQQQALMDSGKGVTNAGAGMSYHNYRLAFDVVPVEYISQSDWNPSGPLWDQLGTIGKSIGLEWGGDWSKPDRPHFQLPSASAPIRELKSYFEKFGEIMPISISQGSTAILLLLVVGAILYLSER